MGFPDDEAIRGVRLDSKTHDLHCSKLTHAELALDGKTQRHIVFSGLSRFAY